MHVGEFKVHTKLINAGVFVQVVDRRVKLMQDEGVEFKTSVDVGKDVQGTDLLAKHDAMLLALGSTWPRDLPIPGRTPVK